LSLVGTYKQTIQINFAFPILQQPLCRRVKRLLPFFKFISSNPKSYIPFHTMRDKSRFFSDVYEVVRLIPAGRVTTYGAIAQYMGLKSAARMVGWAMNAAHSVPDVPAHRVVNRNGLLTGKHHFGSNDEMQRLLEAEGVAVKNDQVQQFGQLLWEPAKEIIV
jgi:methylated-DNA-protein-cysteine methyltransferase-like protein